MKHIIDRDVYIIYIYKLQYVYNFLDDNQNEFTIYYFSDIILC